MIGAPSIFVVFVFLFLACVAGALLSVAAAIWGTISLSRRNTKRGIILFVISALLLSPLAAIIITGQLARHRELTIERDLSLPIERLALNSRVRKLDDGRISHQVWGQLYLRLKIPGGGELIGYADRMTIVTDANGKLDILQVYYEPELPSIAGERIDDVFAYWEKQGVVTTASNSGRFREIQIKPFTLTLDGIGRAIRFELRRNKEQQPEQD
jgi:hypothetical protein